MNTLQYVRKIWLNILLCVVFIFLLVSFLYGYSVVFNNIIAGFVLFFSGYSLYIYRKNIAWFITLFFIAYTNYSIVVGVYWDSSLRMSYYYQIESVTTYGIGIMCVMLFTFFICYCSLFLKSDVYVKYSIREVDCNIQKNNVICLICIALYIFCFIYGLIHATSVIDNRIGNSAIKEYRIIFLIIGIVYSRHDKLIRNIWFIVIAVTTIVVLFGGSRADALAPLLCFFIYYYSDSLKCGQVLLVLVPAIILMAAVGYFRTDFSFSLDSFAYTISKLMNDKLTYEGAIAAYFPSLAMIEVTDILSISERAMLLLRHIIYVPLGSKIGDPNLSFFSHDYYKHYYGFISPSYFYVWVGMASPLLLAALVFMYLRWYYKSLNPRATGKNRKRMHLALSLYFLSTVFRWYEYGPMGLLRGVFVFIIVYFVLYFADAIMRKAVHR